MALVTYENVAEASEALIANGQKPSVRNVIKQLGGGSPNAVLKLLGEFKSGRPVIRLTDVDLDPAIVAAIKRQMQTVAAEATVAAEERAASLTDDLQTLAESSQQLESANEQLANELTTVRDELDALITRGATDAAEAAHKLDTAQAKINELSADLHDERQRSSDAQVALGKAQARVEAIPALEAQITKLQNDLEAERKEHAAADQRTAVAEAQIKLVGEQADKVAADLIKAESKHSDELKILRKDLDAARDQAAELRGLLTAEKAAAESARYEHRL